MRDCNYIDLLSVVRNSADWKIGTPRNDNREGKDYIQTYDRVSKPAPKVLIPVTPPVATAAPSSSSGNKPASKLASEWKKETAQDASQNKVVNVGLLDSNATLTPSTSTKSTKSHKSTPSTAR